MGIEGWFVGCWRGVGGSGPGGFESLEGFPDLTALAKGDGGVHRLKTRRDPADRKRLPRDLDHPVCTEGAELLTEAVVEDGTEGRRPRIPGFRRQERRVKGARWEDELFQGRVRTGREGMSSRLVAHLHGLRCLGMRDPRQQCRGSHSCLAVLGWFELVRGAAGGERLHLREGDLTEPSQAMSLWAKVPP